MDNFSFKTWNEYKSEEQVNEGFNVSSDYISPNNETEVRNQLQSLHSQIKKFINETIVAGINSILSRLGIAEGKVTDLETNEITSIVGDDTIGVTKSGKKYSISLITSPTGVTKTYVDNQIESAKSYTDNKIEDAKDYTDLKSSEALEDARSYVDSRLLITTGKLLAGETTITLYNPNIHTNSALAYYTPTIGIDPEAAIVNEGSVTLTFEAQQEDMMVGVRIDGAY